MSLSCGWCGKPVERRSKKGPAPRYCNPSHRQSAYQERRAERVALSTGDVVKEWEDANGLLWQEVRFVGGPLAVMTRAACRPESCADGHVCGKLDIGVVE